MLARTCALVVVAVACDATLTPISGSSEPASPGRSGGDANGAPGGDVGGAGGVGPSGNGGSPPVVTRTGLEAYALNDYEIMLTVRYTNETGEAIPLGALTLRIHVVADGGTLAGRFDDAQFAEPYQDLGDLPRFSFDTSTPPRYAEIGFPDDTRALAPGTTLIIRAGLFEATYQSVALQADGFSVYRDGAQLYP